MFVWALMGHISNKIFKMEYEAHAYGIELEFENVLKKVKLKKKNSFFIFKWNRIFIQFWFSIESGKKSL